MRQRGRLQQFVFAITDILALTLFETRQRVDEIRADVEAV